MGQIIRLPPSPLKGRLDIQRMKSNLGRPELDFILDDLTEHFPPESFEGGA